MKNSLLPAKVALLEGKEKDRLQEGRREDKEKTGKIISEGEKKWQVLQNNYHEF